MNRFQLIAAIAALAALPALAQTNRYSATTGDVSLSATATTLTIQNPAADVNNGNPRNVTLESFTVYCSVACSVSQAYNGTAATATAATRVAIPPNTTAVATATAWSASNVGTGTAVGPIVHVPAGGTVTLVVPLVVVNGSGTGGNYSVTVAAITGTANITGIWSERQ